MATPRSTSSPRIVPTAKQLEAIRAIKRRIRYILTGGAISTAKSYGLAQVFISMSMQFPRTRYGIFRKHLTVLKRTTYQTFRKVAFEYGLIEGVHYKVNRSEMYWEFTNGSQIFFMELDESKDPDFNKVKGLELTAAGIDEMNEVVKEGWLIVASRVGRENHHGEPQFVLGTCNPADNWVKEEFYTPWIKGELPADHAFIPSLPQDNPHNSEEYLASLNAMPEQFRKRYVEGNWDYVDDANALFPNRVIDRALCPSVPKVGERFIAADIAREGSDRTIFSLVEGETLTDLFEPDIEIGDEVPILIQTADELIRYALNNGVTKDDAWRVAVDAVGLGAGVVDACRKRGWMVSSFKSGERSKDEHKDGQPMYDNLRSERYWKLSQAMQSGSFRIWEGVPFLEELRKDLLAHTYEVTDKQFVVESKQKMKKRLRRSPDFADAVAMAFRPKSFHNANEVITLGSYDSDDDY